MIEGPEHGFCVMGLDLSLTGTGIVVRDLNGLTKHHQCVGYSLRRADDERLRVERLIDIRAAVHSVIDGFGVRAIGIERYAYGARGAQNDLAELHGVVKVSILEKFCLDCEYVGIQTARKAALGRGSGFGKGKAGKQEVLRQCRIAAGIEFGTTDEADAWAVSEYLRLKHLTIQQRSS